MKAEELVRNLLNNTVPVHTYQQIIEYLMCLQSLDRGNDFELGIDVTFAGQPEKFLIECFKNEILSQVSHEIRMPIDDIVENFPNLDVDFVKNAISSLVTENKVISRDGFLEIFSAKKKRAYLRQRLKNLSDKDVELLLMHLPRLPQKKGDT